MASAGFTVVSGLAEGMDTAAHTSALAAGGRTVAVIGTGLGHCYPAENCELQRRITEHVRRRLAILAGDAAQPGHVPAAQRGHVRVVARDGDHRGIRAQRRTHPGPAGAGHGRPVFLLRRLLGESWAQEMATRPGVHLVDEPADIIDIVERLNATDTLIE